MKSNSIETNEVEDELDKADQQAEENLRMTKEQVFDNLRKKLNE